MKLYKLPNNTWYIERIVYLMAGIFVFGSVVLGLLVNENFFYFTSFIGLLLIIFALTGYCPMAIILDKCEVKRGVSFEETKTTLLNK